MAIWGMQLCTFGAASRSSLCGRHSSLPQNANPARKYFRQMAFVTKYFDFRIFGPSMQEACLSVAVGNRFNKNIHLKI